MARDIESNGMIERETEGLKYFSSTGLNTPKIFSTGKMGDLNYVCEEIISGQPVGKRSEAEYFYLVAEYHNSVKKIKKIKIASVSEAIKDLGITGDQEYEQAIKLLNKRKERDIYVANQHGDLTYKNLMKKDGGGIVFIDFENFGLRSVWGNDVIHYLVRMTNVFDFYKENKDVSENMSRFVETSKVYREKYNLGIDDEECADLFLLDLLFNDLQRTYFSVKKEIIPLMKNIWSK